MLNFDYTSGTAKRQRAYAGRQRDSGRRRVNWWLSNDIIDEIDRRAMALGGDKATALNTVLQTLLAHTKPAAATATKPKLPEPAPMAAPVLVSTTETARRLHITVPTLVQWRKAGRGPRAVRVKDTWRYSEQDIDAWIQEGKQINEEFARASEDLAKEFARASEETTR